MQGLFNIRNLWRLAPYAFFCALMVGGAQAVAQDEVRFQRSNHLISDLDTALSVYRDVLGLKLVAVRALPKGGYAYELFQLPAEADLRFAVLSSDSQSNILALTEVKNTSFFEAGGQSALSRVGIVLEVQDFDGVIARAKTAGLTMFAENAFTTSDGGAGRQQGLLDFDHNLIVIYQIIK